jgi:hypothetical protein
MVTANSFKRICTVSIRFIECMKSDEYSEELNKHKITFLYGKLNEN